MLYADLYLLKPALIDAEQLIGLQSELSPDEYRHWYEIRQPGRQREYLLGRILLRRLLAERLGCPPDALVFRTGEHGKPTLVGGPAGEPVILGYAGRQLFAVVVLTLRDGLIVRIDATADPSARVDRMP